MKGVFVSPSVRLILRALVVTLTTFLVQLNDSQTWDSSLIRSAVVGAVLAGLEYLTPLNPNVGLNKT